MERMVLVNYQGTEIKMKDKEQTVTSYITNSIKDYIEIHLAIKG